MYKSIFLSRQNNIFGIFYGTLDIRRSYEPNYDAEIFPFGGSNSIISGTATGQLFLKDKFETYSDVSPDSVFDMTIINEIKTIKFNNLILYPPPFQMYIHQNGLIIIENFKFISSPWNKRGTHESIKQQAR